MCLEQKTPTFIDKESKQKLKKQNSENNEVRLRLFICKMNNEA